MQEIELGAEIVFIDYLQLIRGRPSGVSMADHLGDITSSLKELAQRYDLPIVLLSQVNRKVEPGEDLELSSIRDSGCIEQDANVLIFINSKKVRSNKMAGAWTVAKNRNGARGVSSFYTFDGALCRFHEIGERELQQLPWQELKRKSRGGKNSREEWDYALEEEE